MICTLALMSEASEQPTIMTCHERLTILPNCAITVVTGANPILFH
jgi:hypothetical protein